MIVIVEHNWFGHHPVYFARMVYEMSKVKEVLAFCPDVERGTKLIEKLGADIGDYKLFSSSFDLSKIPLKRKIPAFYNQALFESVKKDIESSGSSDEVEHVIFCCLYSGAWPFWKKLVSVFPYDWSALMIDSMLVREGSLIKRIKKYRDWDPCRLYRSLTCRSILTFEHEYREIIEAAFHKNVLLIPDYCEVKSGAATDDFEISSYLSQIGEKKVVSILGGLAPRKAIMELVRAAKSVDSREWGLLFAGVLHKAKFTNDEQSELYDFFDNDPYSTIHEGHISNEATYNAYVEASDIVFLYYKDFYGSSGNLSKAVHFKKPVIAWEEGCIGMRVEKYGLGLTIPSLESELIVESIETLLSWTNYGGDLTSFNHDHSVERFPEVMQCLVKL